MVSKASGGQITLRFIERPRNNFRTMINRFIKQLPQDAVRTAAYCAVAGLIGVKVFPVLREWDVFAAFPSKAYMEREVCDTNVLLVYAGSRSLIIME